MSIAVLGIGTAGITSLSHCLSFLSDDWSVISISDPQTPILGIGESTTIAIPKNLYHGTKFSLFRDNEYLDATIKHGVKYTEWRKHDIFSHIIPPSYGIHFNNFKLKDFAFDRFKKIWKDKFKSIQGRITEIKSEKNGVKLIVDDSDLHFDYVIDCRGYPENYSDYIVSEYIPVNHCLVNMIPEPGNWTWTYHTAHRNGWMFGIPLQSRQGWGYLYNDTITEKEDAIDDIAQRFNRRPDDLQLREFKFKNYYSKQFLSGRILKNGNRALFFEPIEALSGFFYDQVMRHFFDFLNEVSTEKQINRYLYSLAQDMEAFVCYIYHGGSIHDSPFWTATKQKAYDRLHTDFKFKSYIHALTQLDDHEKSEHRLLGIFTTPNWIDFDKQFGYNYFTNTNDSLEY